MQSFYSQGFISIIIVCLVVLCLGGFRRKNNLILQFVQRGVLSFIAIVLLNRLFAYLSVPVFVGMNMWTMLIGAILGIPGICLLFGISLF
nr:pro-sigmaK processing inhibitor BofA family protein [Lachnospiraceae bacterium]